MKQLLLKEGAVIVEDVPAPQVSPGTVVVRVAHSCISAGTEISGVRSSGEPVWKRAMKHPDEVKLALKMASEQGVRRIHRMVKSKLTSGTAIGYSAAGVVLAVGEGVNDVVVGDRVACAGAQCAHHAEIIRVPRNLLVRLPDSLTTHDASTVTLGAIALQGVRRLEPSLGETVVVVGLGILGQLVIQILRANGCQVVGIDLDAGRVKQARAMGADYAFQPSDENAIGQVQRFTKGYGADGVIITASTSSDSVLSQAFQMCRKRGRVVLVGDVGMNIERADMFKKELDFRISTSYGPGRYDETYEEGGIDYPFSHVRWTENRNMEEYLRLLDKGLVNLDGLVTRVVDIDDAGNTYQEMKNGSSDLMVLLQYPDRPDDVVSIAKVSLNDLPAISNAAGIGVIGAGSFAKSMHLPNIESMPELFSIKAIMSWTGHNAKAVASQFKADYATTDMAEVLADETVNAVLITTRHNQHGQQVIESLKAGKHVFVEKPLALTAHELDQIENLYAGDECRTILLTGFNRRFSPHMTRLKEILETRSNPMILNYRMNAGYVPLDNWVHGEEGGGRNLGEACHIYDLFTYLTGAQVKKVQAQGINPRTGYYGVNDNFVVSISFDDGSVATLTYTALGNTAHTKEQLDLYVDGKVILMNDYKTLDITGVKQKGLTTRRIEKGQVEELRAFGEAITTGSSWPIPLWQQLQATRIALQVEDQIGPGGLTN